MRCVVRHFSELTTSELLDLMILRVGVFVVEQKCPYQEIDEQDRSAWHLWLYDDDKKQCVACSRLFTSTLDHFTAAEGVVLKASEQEQPSASRHATIAVFGRVAVHAEYRAHGLGRRLVTETLAATRQLLPQHAIWIGAQAHLEKFYGSYGFTTESNVFLEDDIPHILMKLEA